MTDMTRADRSLIFIRTQGWYQISHPVGDDLTAHVRSNPGTLQIQDAQTGEVLWEPARQ